MDEAPKWGCNLCGVVHSSPGRDVAPYTPPETVDRLRAEWHRAVDLLDARPDDPSCARRELRTSLAYFGTMASGAWLWPSELTTMRSGPHIGWSIVCHACVAKFPKDELLLRLER
ncbi:MAG: hypothetical protein KF764_11350 [Labilithrix sp.]|nr:hypothetical protein [Labilithrix sp.]